MSNRKIYVGNIPYSTQEEDLTNIFAECGEIEEVKIIRDYETGRSKGFAFVTFETTEAMQKALSKDGEDMGGRNLRVNEAENKKRDNFRKSY